MKEFSPLARLCAYAMSTVLVSVLVGLMTTMPLLDKTMMV